MDTGYIRRTANPASFTFWFAHCWLLGSCAWRKRPKRPAGQGGPWSSLMTVGWSSGIQNNDLSVKFFLFLGPVTLVGTQGFQLEVQPAQVAALNVHRKSLTLRVPSRMESYVPAWVAEQLLWQTPSSILPSYCSSSIDLLVGIMGLFWFPFCPWLHPRSSTGRATLRTILFPILDIPERNPTMALTQLCSGLESTLFANEWTWLDTIFGFRTSPRIRWVVLHSIHTNNVVAVKHAERPPASPGLSIS